MGFKTLYDYLKVCCQTVEASEVDDLRSVLTSCKETGEINEQEHEKLMGYFDNRCLKVMTVATYK